MASRAENAGPEGLVKLGMPGIISGSQEIRYAEWFRVGGLQKTQAIGRGGGARLGAIFYLKQLCHPVRRALASPNCQQTTSEDANHIVQKTVCTDINQHTIVLS